MADVTVIVPFYGPTEFLRQCVESLIKQTHFNLKVLVIGDGVAVPEFFDPRVVSYSIPENRGTYFCRQIGLMAAASEWVAVFDADDWAEPEWLETMLAKAQAENLDIVQSSVRYQIEEGGQHRVVPFPKAYTDIPRHQLVHLVSHVGLYRTSVLRDFGGYNPGQRFGWDTLLVSLTALRCSRGLIDVPLWHRRRHPGAMTRKSDTRPNSPARTANHEFLTSVYAKAMQLENPGEYLKSLFPVDLVDEVSEHVRAVSPLLNRSVPSVNGVPKLLHTFWSGPAMPESIAGYIRSWREMNPDWSVRVWSEQDVASGALRLSEVESFLYWNQARLSPSSNEWQYKSNIARLRMLHDFGGVWFDADFECLKPIDSLIEQYAPFVCREDGKFVNNGLLAFPPKHPFIRRCLDVLHPRIMQFPSWRSNRQSGPHMYTDMMKFHPEVNIVPTELVYPLTYRQAKAGLTADDVDLNNAWAVHHWRSERSRQGNPL